MEAEILTTLTDCICRNQPAALVTVIAHTGPSPGKTGAIMLVRSDGATLGTVGGGSVEHQAISEALRCLASGKNKEICLSLNNDEKIGMTCGGESRVFIKVFIARPQLIIVGAGHIGVELYQLGLHQNFKVVVIDDRSSQLTLENFPLAERILAKDQAAALSNYSLDKDCYITIATSSHQTDRTVLKAAVVSPASYIGMIGSTSKVKAILQHLLDTGISQHHIQNIYAPMGLNIGSISPKEIAFSIISEILMVKNNGTPQHMRTVKRIHMGT